MRRLYCLCWYLTTVKKDRKTYTHTETLEVPSTSCKRFVNFSALNHWVVCGQFAGSGWMLAGTFALFLPESIDWSSPNFQRLVGFITVIEIETACWRDVAMVTNLWHVWGKIDTPSSFSLAFNNRCENWIATSIMALTSLIIALRLVDFFITLVQQSLRSLGEFAGGGWVRIRTFALFHRTS